MSRATKFGLFEADLSAGELRKQGRLIRLQHQPFELLRCLLARPGEIVSREHLRQRLWAADVVVDFDQSLNKSVTKLRDALGDSAGSPRFVETLPKRGYRFIAPVTLTEGTVSAPGVADAPAAPLAPVTPALPLTRMLSSRRLILLGVMAGLIVIVFNYSGSIQRASPAITKPVATNESSSASTDDAEAREAYGRGRIALSRRTEDGLRSGVELFGRALALDPRYASAHVGLADAWSLLASYGMEEPRSALQRARDHANRALQLNPGQADAHTSLGRTTMIGNWDWQTAEWHFQRALALRESAATPHQWYAYLLSATGRHAEAEREARRAAQIDPTSLNAATGVGYVLYAARRFDDAAAALRRVIEVDPDFMPARRNLGLVLAMQGRDSEAVTEFERVLRLSGESALAQADLAWMLGRSGDLPGARRLLGRLQARDTKRYVPPDAMALALSGAGQVEAAVIALKEAFDRRVATMAHLSVDPIWDHLRAVPRVRIMADAVKAGRSGPH